MQKRYVIQCKIRPWDTSWITCPSRQYDTLEEAKEAYNNLPIKADHRIAEAYTVVRYRAVKL